MDHLRRRTGRPRTVGRRGAGGDARTTVMPTSLPRRRLPELDLVPLRVHDPPELPVLRVIRLLEHVAAFLAQRLKQPRQVFDAIVDHEGRLARGEGFAIRREERPDGRSLGRVAFGVGPGEGRAAPVLDVDPEVPLVPGAQGLGIPRAQEDAADAGHASHCEPSAMDHLSFFSRLPVMSNSVFWPAFSTAPLPLRSSPSIVNLYSTGYLFSPMTRSAAKVSSPPAHFRS